MLSGYLNIWQDGIEPIEGATEPVKDKETNHCYFDQFRMALKYKFNGDYKTSGVGVVVFAPNGLLWYQRPIYCFELDKFGSLYYAIDESIEEMKKCKSKEITIFVDDKLFVESAKKDRPYKLDAYNQVHDEVIGNLRQFEKFNFVYRNKYPKSVEKRLSDESRDASEPLKFDWRGHWSNQPNELYSRVTDHNDEEMKFKAESFARIYMEFMESYAKEFIQDYGKEKFDEFVQKVKEGKAKSLPKVKRVKEAENRDVKLKKPKEFYKEVVCQNCGEKMYTETVFKSYPDKIIIYRFRCKKCLAGKEITEKGRTITYLKYPPPKKE